MKSVSLIFAAWIAASVASFCAVEADSCDEFSSCSACSAAPGCGWGNGSTCSDGNATGAFQHGLSNSSWVWLPSACEGYGSFCHNFDSCIACALSRNCGWADGIACYPDIDYSRFSISGSWITSPSMCYAIPAQAPCATSNVTYGRLQEFISELSFAPTRWNDPSVPACAWPGVTCGQRGAKAECAVVGISLYCYWGDLASRKGVPSLSPFPYLQILRIQGCGLQGTLPSNWSTVAPNLTIIDLSGNRLSGPLPPEWSDMRELRVLYLNDNWLSGTLPVRWRDFNLLQVLDLYSNVLNGTLPAEWHEMSSLVGLQLWSNQMSGTLPPEWGSMETLLDLELDSNQLVGTLPAAWGSLHGLRTLWLSFNQLNGTLPSEWSRMDSLAYSYLTLNQLSGTLPPAWASMSSLRNLYLSYNQLTGTLPSGWGGLESLVELYLAGNRLVGTLPADWASLPQLSILKLDNNDFVGRLPAEWGNLSRLQNLTLDHNRLTGTLPPLWRGMVKILGASISNNQLYGTLPPEWANMTDLQGLDLSSNHLTGTLPAEFGSLKQLQLVNLANNRLNGTVPSAWINETSVESILLSGNLLRGPLPTGWSRKNNRVILMLDISRNPLNCTLPGEAKRIQSIDLSYAQIYGALPREWAEATSLQDLVLSNNQLNGTLPVEWSNMTAPLRSLDLSSNKLNGSLPKEWAKLRQLQTLDLSSNFLEGTLPPEWARFSALTSLDLSMNLFKGTFPREWTSSWTLLNVLRLGANSLNGSIPPFSNMVNLQLLDVSGNDFSSFPSQLSSEWAPNLKVFLGANNNFTGSLPLGISNHTLCAFDVSGNKLNATTKAELGSAELPFRDFRPWLQLWILSLSENDWSGNERIEFDGVVDDTRVEFCRLYFGQARYLDISSNNASFVGMTPQKGSTTATVPSELIPSFDAAFQNFSVSAFYAKSNVPNRRYVGCPGSTNSTCTCGEVCAPSVLRFNSDFTVTKDSYIVGASVMAMRTRDNTYSLRSFNVCSCDMFPASSNSGVTTFIAQDFSSTLTVSLEPPEESANLWDGKSSPVAPTPSGYIPLQSGVLVVTLRFGVPYQLKASLQSQPLFRAQGDPPVITANSKTFQRDTCASPIQVPIRNTTLCAPCPNLAECNGTEVLKVKANVTAWRPRTDVLPFYSCDALSDGCNVSDNNGTRCKDGYEGALCAVCAEGYGLAWGSCEKCELHEAITHFTAGVIILGALLYVSFVAYSAVARIHSTQNQRNGDTPLELNETAASSTLPCKTSSSLLFSTQHNTVSDSDPRGRQNRVGCCKRFVHLVKHVFSKIAPFAVTLKIITNHLGIMGLVGAVAIKAIPRDTHDGSRKQFSFFVVQNTVGNLAIQDAASMSCVYGATTEGPNKLYTALIVAGCLPLLGAVMGLVLRKVKWTHVRTIWAEEEKYKFGLKPLLAVAFAVLRVLQPSVVQYSAQLLPCTSLTFYSTSDYLLYQLEGSLRNPPKPLITQLKSVADRSLDCVAGDAGSAWADYRIVALATLVTAGYLLPLLLAATLRIFWKRTASSHYSPVVFGYFVKNFKRKAYLWEFVLMARLAVGWSVLALMQEERLQFSGLLTFLAVFWMLHARVLPYQRFQQNVCEHLTYASAIVALNCYEVVKVYAQESEAAEARTVILDIEGARKLQEAFQLIATVVQIVALVAVVLAALPQGWIPALRSLIKRSPKARREIQRDAAPNDLEALELERMGGVPDGLDALEKGLLTQMRGDEPVACSPTNGVQVQ